MVPDRPPDPGFGEAGGAVPFARPVVAGSGEWGAPLAYARPAPRRIPVWRALLEVFAILVLAIMGDLLVIPLAVFWRPADPRWFSVAGTFVKGFAAIALCVWLLRVEGRPLKSLGWTARGIPLNILIGVGAWVCAFVAQILISLVLSIYFPQMREHGEDATKAIRAAFPDMSLGVIIGVMCFVGLWEETAFRGFILTRLQAMFGRWWLTVAVGAVVFGLGHLYQGPLAVPLIVMLGVLMGILFWWRKSLVPCIVFHALFDIMNFLLIRLR